MSELSKTKTEADAEVEVETKAEADSNVGDSNCPAEPQYNRNITILIDTNGFMIPVQFGIDIFSELRRLGFTKFLTIPAVISELEKLSKTLKGNDRIAARVALQLSKQCEVPSDSLRRTVSGKYADDIIIESAVKYSVCVLTNDAGLRQKLMSKDVVVVSMRQTNRLDIITQK
ncbi:DNA-binding protein [Methanimicrococcus sp. OttesenSCG-928-J09]|nr:DNA-binding protein [Methanimicrococcus sp. OttesenSCG-928-J09]